MYTVFAFGEVFYVFEGAAFTIPGWLVALVAMLLFEAALCSAPVLGIIVIALFFMAVAMIEQVNVKAWMDGKKDRSPIYVKYIKLICSLAMNLGAFIYAAGSFLIEGALEHGSMFSGGGWLNPLFNVFIISQAARLLMHLLAAVFSWITKWAGVAVSNIFGILSYVAGAGVFIYYFYVRSGGFFTYLERLCYGISMIFGGGAA